MNSNTHGHSAAVSTTRFAVKAMALAMAVVTVSALASLPGFAADRSMKIQTSDLDLKTEKGAAKLYSRIETAASTMCGPVSLHMLERHRVWRTCYERTLLEAVTSINEPAVLAIYRQRNNAKPANAG